MTIMHTKNKRIIGDKFDAAAGKYETCPLAVRDYLLAMVEVVTCPFVVWSLRRFDEQPYQ